MQCGHVNEKNMQYTGVLLNLTPHSVRIYDATKTRVVLEIPSHGPAMRLIPETQKEIRSLKLIEKEITLVLPPTFVGVENIPKTVDVMIIVSSLVAEFLIKHDEYKNKYKGIFAPDTGPSAVVRDEQGGIIGTTRLVKYL